MKIVTGLMLALLAVACARELADTAVPSGIWRAVLELPGGELPFLIEIERADDGYRAQLRNGEERVEVEDLRVHGNEVTLAFPAFNNRIEARLANGRLEGRLILIKGGGVVQVMPFRAEHGREYRFFPPDSPVFAPVVDLSGRWAVTFRDDHGETTPAIGEFTQRGADLRGTFLTPTGDYRYLAGQVRGGRLYLSTFDGAHAFLFVASLAPDGALRGDLWSGTAWHERWQAERDPQASLPDSQRLTFLKPGYERFDFVFPDLDGRPVALSDARFEGKVVLVTLAGSWCPNCHDEAAFLAPFYQSYRDQGLEVIALMYEHFDDFATAAEQTRKFRAKFGIDYHTLIAGVSDKAEASKTLPMLNRVLAFPTTIFVDRRGRVRQIHTGFSGPATGAHFAAWQREFVAFVEALLEEPA